MNNVIVFDAVNKNFFLQHQKTLKEFVQAFFVRQKTIEMVRALSQISFTIPSGQSVGVIGKNGAGKSTLLSLIAGVTSPTSGKISVNGRVAPLIELGAGFHPELTARENIFLNGVILGLKEDYIKSCFNDIIAFSELTSQFIDMPIKHYSSGMYMRLAFSVAIFTDPQILIIDEILAVGDSAFQKKCLAKMEEFKKKGITIIYVSHALEVVEYFCSRVLYLNKGKLVFDGNAARAIELYRNDLTRV